MTTKEHLRRRIGAVRRHGGSRYPADLRKEIKRYAEARKAEGLTFRDVTAEIGMNWHTMMGWRKSKHARKALRRVKIVTPSTRPEREMSAKSLTVRFAGGATVQGLDIGQVAELIRRLS